MLALLNGGAAVALLAYLGNLAGKPHPLPMPDMRYPMAFFLAGLVLCGLCFITSYLTQFTLYNEAMGVPNDRFYKKHRFWLTLALALVLSSIISFALGAYSAVASFK